MPNSNGSFSIRLIIPQPGTGIRPAGPGPVRRLPGGKVSGVAFGFSAYSILHSAG